MDVEEGLKFAEQLLNRTLKPLEVLIFQESWKGRDGKKYKEIAETYSCTVGNVNDAASELWKLLSEVLGEAVRKNNFQRLLEKRWRSHSAEVSQPQEPVQEVTASKRTDFVGREEAIAHLNTLITSREAKVIGIYGKGGVGKTKLAEQYFEQYFETKGFKTLRLDVGTETRSITRVEGWLEDCLRLDFREELGQKLDFTRLLDRLRRKLQAQRVGLLIDNLEPALDENGKFIEPGYVQLLRLLAKPNVMSITLITSRECPNESKVTIEPYPLPDLDEDAWRECFSRYEINANTPALSAMHQAYGGNALAMKVLCYPIQTTYDGDLDAYWQDYKNFLLKGEIKDLIASQFDRLQELDIKAYKILCRLGIYRYRNIAKVSIIGFQCLYWDVLRKEGRQIIESLIRRNLLEFHKGEYWLHPMIREEARARLRESEGVNDVLKLMKQQIDAFVGSEEELQQFLIWLHQKSSSVKVPYKPSSVRAFYLVLEFSNELKEALELACVLDPSFEFAFKFNEGEFYLNDDRDLDLSLARAYDFDFAIDFELNRVLARACYLYLYLEPSSYYSPSLKFRILAIALNRVLALDIESKLKQELEHLKQKLPIVPKELTLEQSLEKLKQQISVIPKEPTLEQLPEHMKKPLAELVDIRKAIKRRLYIDWHQEIDIEWWKTNGEAWAMQLRDVMIQHRNIGRRDWSLSEHQEELLWKYYDANKLLVDCLNNTAGVTPEVRSQIEDELFLPIAEIEQRRRN